MNKHLTVKDVIHLMEELAPQDLAYPQDPVGLHFGSFDKPVHKIMTTLDVRPSVVDEAIEKGVDLIIAHHPPIFRAPERWTDSDPQTSMFLKLVRHDISVYAAHTNLDLADHGINDMLADLLELQDTEIMRYETTRPLFKLVTYVPKEDAEKVRQALNEAGAGKLDDLYSGTSYTVQGQGRFTPSSLANPTIGQAGRSEVVEEEALAFTIDQGQIEDLINLVRQAHPYEVPVIDVFPIENQGPAYGLGRVGNLSQPVSLGSFIAYLKEVFQIEGLRVVGKKSLDEEVSRIAIAGGSCGKYYKDALKAQADVYITGDVDYHIAHDMEETSLTVIDPGHHIEAVCKEALKDYLQPLVPKHIEVISSALSTDPFHFY